MLRHLCRGGLEHPIQLSRDVLRRTRHPARRTQHVARVHSFHIVRHDLDSQPVYTQHQLPVINQIIKSTYYSGLLSRPVCQVERQRLIPRGRHVRVRVRVHAAAPLSDVTTAT